VTTLSSSVGRKSNGVAAQSLPADQEKVISLLDRISPIDGGQRGVWTRPAPGKAQQPPAALVTAIKAFQLRWIPTGEVKKVDGVVDPDGATLRQLDAKAGASIPVGPGGTDPNLVDGIVIEQINTQAGTPFMSSMQVLGPIFKDMPLSQITVAGAFFPFLFELRKDGHIYWVGVAAPPLTSDFTKAQVYLHPTPEQAGVATADYKKFKGGWRERMFNYVMRGGAQLSAIRSMLCIVPFMPDHARNPDSTLNVFATRPVETLNAIVTATHREMAKRIPIVGPRGLHKLSQIGVTSFSSGIAFMRMFIGKFGESGLIAETIDLDSRWIIAERKKNWVRASGARAVWIAQWAPPEAPRNPPPGYRPAYPPAPQIGFTYLSAQKLERTKAWKTDAHHTIGFHGYHWAMMNSVVR
jgi:hypothetical protein